MLATPSFDLGTWRVSVSRISLGPLEDVTYLRVMSPARFRCAMLLDCFVLVCDWSAIRKIYILSAAEASR